jgi:transcriptional regulator with XRE-family HTH domain
MTTSTGEDRGLDPAAANRGAIPADTYAHRLMLARAHAGNLSIRAAADRCGLNYASWANWEQGTRSRTQPEDAQAISEELGVDLQWLLYGGPLTKPARPVPRSRRSRHTDWPENTSGYSRKPAKRTNRPPVHSNGFRRPGSVRRPIAA